MQSRGFYLDAPSGQLADETATLRYDAPGPIGESTRVMGAYEDRVLGSTALQGVVLRYGFFYGPGTRSEEHTSELQSLMRISYAVFCLKKKNKNNKHIDLIQK